MRKTFFLALAASMSTSLLAQVPAPANRTAKTIVADSLAALPAQNQKDFNAIMEGLVQTKGEGVALLADMCSSVNVPSVNYALSGLASYVAQEGREEARVIFVNSLFDEIQEAKDVEVKKFYIRLLGICARDEMVDKIAPLMGNEQLRETAADTLIDVNTAKADQALLGQLAQCDKELAAHIIGQAQIMGQESELIAWYKDADEDTKKTILYALAQTGSQASIDLLLAEAKAAKYTFDKRSAVDRLCMLLTRLASTDAPLVMKTAKQLFDESKAVMEVQTMVSAVEVMMLANLAEAKPMIVKLALDENLLLRSGVLNLLTGCADRGIFVDIAKGLDSASDAAKISAIAYLGDHYIKETAEYVEKYMDSDQPALAKAAILASAKLQAGDDIIEEICEEMIESKDKGIIDTASKALSYVKYKKEEAKAYAGALCEVVEKGSPYAQVKAIELLAARAATTSFATVAEKLESPDAAVAKAAFTALATIVGPDHSEQVITLLKQAKPEQVGALQNALYTSLSAVPAEKRAAVIAAMIPSMGEKKALLYIVLTRLGDVKTFQTMATEFNNAPAADKAQYIHAMSAWKGQPVYSYLTDTISACAEGDKVGLWHTYMTHVETQDMTGENKRLFASNVLANSPDMPQKIRAITVIGNSGSYLGMLTVAPYMDSDNATMKEAACQAVMKIALNNKSYTGPQVISILEKCSATLKNPDAGYQREAIAKHIGEMPEESGYIAIFNGKDLSGWKGLVGNPLTRQAMSSDELAKAQAEADKKMNAHWSVKNGSMYFNGHGDNICTDKQYGDFEMLVDWKLYKTGKEADAGIYLRGTPQVQIWDISRTNVGAQVGSGGLYNNQKNPAKPLKVMDNELGEWNTFYIKMQGDKVTVIMNGETVVDNVVLENFWKRDIPLFVKEQIELQAHGSEVEYKNIYVRELASEQKTATLSDAEKTEGFKLLFDGVSMEGWQGNTQAYVAEDGCIVMYPEKGHGNLYTDKEYENFVLRFEFWLTPGANNGLGVRTPMNVDAAYHGMELQILDNEADIYKALEVYQYHGSVYGIAAAKRGFLKPTGEWNVQEVIADGNKIKVTLNGEVILETDIAKVSENNTKTLDGQPHPGLLNKKGFLGFLGHGSHVKFRNLRIKEL